MMTSSSQAGSRNYASHTQWQEKDSAKKTTDTSGQKCVESYAKFSRHGSWAKTFSGLLIGMEGWSSTRCKLTWKLKGTKYNRMFFQLAPSTLPTEGTEFGLLPTVTANGADRNTNFAQGGTCLKNGLINAGFLPTPTAMDATGATANMKSTQVKEGSMHSVTLSRWAGMLITPRTSGQESYQTRLKRQGHQKAMTYLKAAVEYLCQPQQINLHNLRLDTQQIKTTIPPPTKLLPTPATQDWKGARSEEALEEAGRNRTNSLPDSFAQPGQTSQLSPHFVLEMMGFPTNWTELPFLNGETNQ